MSLRGGMACASRIGQTSVKRKGKERRSKAQGAFGESVSGTGQAAVGIRKGAEGLHFFHDMFMCGPAKLTQLLLLNEPFQKQELYF